MVSIEVFGITGTNGKTTVSYMLKSILEEVGKNCALVGTISHCIGENDYEAVNTTPSKELLKRYFHEMKEQNIGTCIMEVSSHGLDQGRIDGVSVHYSGFTNLSQDHLDYHVTMENYFEAKTRLFFMTKKSMAINIDNVYGKRLYDKMTEAHISGEIEPNVRIQSISFEDSTADFFGRLKDNSIKGVVMGVTEDGQVWNDLSVEMPGKTTAYNAMLALAMARQTGIKREDIARGLGNLRGVPGRFQRVENDRGVNLVVDFAHTPDALENLLKIAGEIAEKRLICVFGCGGNRDKEKRSIMGRIAGECCDFCIITSDNPRFEKPADITAEIERGISETQCKYIVEINRYEAIKKAVNMYEQGDLIVVAGRGHEKYQKICGEQILFEDGPVAKNIIDTRE